MEEKIEGKTGTNEHDKVKKESNKDRQKGRKDWHGDRRVKMEEQKGEEE